jgi:hypothetical protein
MICAGSALLFQSAKRPKREPEHYSPLAH